MTAAENGQKSGQSFDVRVLRQDGPGQPPLLGTASRDLRDGHERDQRAAADRCAGPDRRRQSVAPVAWDCNCLEEVCGACTMVINGRVRQACSALVDRLLEDRPGEIELRPMTKFPVIRDLVVDRSRLFHALQAGPGLDPGRRLLRHGPGTAAIASATGSSLSAEPVHELRLLPGSLSAVHEDRTGTRQPGESEEQFEQRRQAAYDRGLSGTACDQPGDAVQCSSHRPA